MKPESGESAAPALGKREANKAEKLANIKQAAHDLFLRHGYDDATTRQIAAEAGVALGTVFTYASTKRDLLFLVANDLLDQTRERAEQCIREDRSLLENFVVYSALHYEAMGAEPELSKLILRELLFYDSGTQGQRAVDNRALLWRDLETMYLMAHKAGEVRLDAKPDVVSRVLFGILQAEIRHWLAMPDRNAVSGLMRLWTSASLVVSGLSIKPVESTISRAAIRELMRGAWGTGSIAWISK